MNRHAFFAIAALIAAPALAQSADKPLGNLLEAIPEARPAETPPPPPAPPPPVPRDGIGSTELPPSAIEPLDPAMPAEEPVELSAEEQRLAELDAAERLRTEALNRAIAERQEATRRRNEEAQRAYAREVAAAEAEAARVAAAYRAEVERVQRQAARERALWEARVRACLDGDRSQCAQPGELPDD